MDYVDGQTKNIKTFEATYLDISLVCRAKKKNKIKTYQQKATYCKHISLHGKRHIPLVWVSIWKTRIRSEGKVMIEF